MIDKKGREDMKKMFIVLSLALLSVLFIYNSSFAQTYNRNARMDGYLYGLELTDKQIQEINRLEIQLEKELMPFDSELRNLSIKLDELEMQRNPDINEIDKVMEKIYRVEDKIIEKENAFNEKIRSLLTSEQKALLDSVDAYGGYGAYLGLGLGRFGCGLGPYRFRGGFGWDYGRGGRGYYGRGYGYGRGLGRGYGYGREEYGYGRGSRGYYGRGYGYGRGIGRGYGYGRGDYGYGRGGRGYYGRGYDYGRGIGRGYDYGRGSYGYRRGLDRGRLDRLYHYLWNLKPFRW